MVGRRRGLVQLELPVEKLLLLLVLAQLFLLVLECILSLLDLFC
jgi:hypothetical protein